MVYEVWQAFVANRLRTVLTMLGMVIGVGAVVLMLAIGAGTQDSINRTLSTLGSNVLMIMAGSATTTGGIRIGSGAATTLTIADGEAIAELPKVLAVTPVTSGTAQIVYGSNNWSAMIFGVAPAFFDIQNWGIASGAVFSDADVRSASNVALIGSTIAENLFGEDVDPTGKTIRIQNNPYLVVGLLATKGQSLEGRDRDDSLYIPITTAQRKLFGSRFRGSIRVIIVKVATLEALTELEQPITDLLRQRHHLAKHMKDDFTIQNLTALANATVQAGKTLSLMLGAIASISLIVGGIGIMNIMLVSVTERTREIGIRAALGARRKDILTQFLLEAIMLSTVGCSMGVILGIGCSILTNLIFDLNIIISLKTILTAFLIAGGVGVFFGYYPARKAAYLKPIEALRYE